MIGLGNMLSFIPNYNTETQNANGDPVQWEHECSAEVSCLAEVESVSGPEHSFLAVGCLAKRVRWFQMGSPRELRKVHGFKAHQSRVACMLVHEQRLYTAGGSNDASIKVWSSPDDCPQDANEKMEPGLLFSLEGHTDTVVSMKRLGSYLISGSSKEDGTMRVWDVEAQKCLQARITCHTAVQGILPIGDDVMITAGNSGDHKICVWSTNPLPQVSIQTSKCSIQ